MNHSPRPESVRSRVRKSDRFLDTMKPFSEVVLVSHPNPDPDALSSMLGLQALLDARQPGKSITLTLDGMIARAENQAMVDHLTIPLVPVAELRMSPAAAIVMVDNQPREDAAGTYRTAPVVVLDHHETPGLLSGVRFRDIRPRLGATATLVTGYLLEQGVSPSPSLATALYYGIDSEISGFPREAGPADDGALVWLFPQADKDLLAQIRNPRLPFSYFSTFHYALSHARLYHNAIVAWCGEVPQPDIIAELADFFIRSDQADWALSIGVFDGLLKLSLRSDHIGGQTGELLRSVVDGLGSAGGHDKRAGGVIPLDDESPASVETLVERITARFLNELKITANAGQPLLDPRCPPPLLADGNR